MLGCPKTPVAKAFVLHGEAKIAFEGDSIIFISKKTDVHTTNLSSANAAITKHGQKDRE